MRVKRACFLGILFILLLFGVTGCKTAGSPDPTTDPAADESLWADAVDPAEDQALREQAKSLVHRIRQRRTEYLLGPEDQLRITVWNRPDLSKETRIRPDGVIFIPLVGNIQADGLTVAQLQETIKKKLARILREPQVDVEIIEYGSKVYYVLGQVTKPGMYPVTATSSVLEAVAISGGPTEKANLGGATLLRGGMVVPIDFYSLFQQGDISQNLMLADGDIIYLPSIDDARIFVLGEVNQAAAVPMRSRRMTLSEAIAAAGGFNELTAYKRAVKIIRGNLANPRVYTVNYDEILRGERPDLAFLQNGDIVYVPSSGLTKWDRVLGQLLPNLSRIVVDAAAIDSLTRNR